MCLNKYKLSDLPRYEFFYYMLKSIKLLKYDDIIIDSLGATLYYLENIENL